MGRFYKSIGHRTTDIRHLTSLGLVDFFTASMAADDVTNDGLRAVIDRPYSP